MKRKNEPAAILVLLLLIPIVIRAQGVKPDTSRIHLDEVTITGTRIPEIPGHSARSVTILNHDQILALPAGDIAGLLEYAPELDVRQRGPMGVQADVSVRGGTFDQYAILINGINFNDPQTGHFALDLPVPVQMIRQIEVLAGSDVKSLGSNAFTGAINLVTTRPSSGGLHASLAGGQYGFLNAGLVAGMSRSAGWQQGGAVLSRSSGYRTNTDFNTLNGFYQAGLDRKRLSLSLMAGGLKKAFGANNFYTPKYPDQYERTGSLLGALQATWSGPIRVAQSIYFRSHLDEFTLFRNDPPSWYLSPNYHQTRIAGAKTDIGFISQLGRTALGLELRRETIRSTVLGESVSNPVEIAAFPGISLDHFGYRTHLSLAAEQNFSTGPLNWNAGVVLHEVWSTRRFFQAYPGIGLSYSPVKRLSTYLSFNRAFRLPTFTELYYQSPTNSGNSRLLPETAWHTELGADYHISGFRVKSSLFYRNASQSIDWLRAPLETVWHAGNLGRIVTFGTESGISWSTGSFPVLNRVLDRMDIGYRRYFQHHSLDSLLSQYVLDYLKWKLTMGATFRLGSAIRLTTNLVWQERNGSYATFDSNQQVVEVDYQPFAVLDARLSWRIRAFTVYVTVGNLLNTKYFDIGGVPQPGSWYTAGLDFDLVGKH